MLKKSSVELFMERVATWWSHLLVPKWSLAAAAVTVCATSFWLLSRPVQNPGAALTVVPAVPEKPFVPKLDLSDLPMARMAEKDKATLNDLLVRNHLEVRPILESKVSPAPTPSSLPATGPDQPTLQKATPAIQSGSQGVLGK